LVTAKEEKGKEILSLDGKGRSLDYQKRKETAANHP